MNLCPWAPFSRAVWTCRAAMLVSEGSQWSQQGSVDVRGAMSVSERESQSSGVTSSESMCLGSVQQGIVDVLGCYVFK